MSRAISLWSALLVASLIATPRTVRAQAMTPDTYLTLKGPLGDRVSYRVTTDIKQGGGTDSYKGWFVRLKYGFLQYDLMKPNADGASDRLTSNGLTCSPMFDATSIDLLKV